MKKLAKVVSAMLTLPLVLSAAACGGGGGDDLTFDEHNMAILEYPDFAETPDDKDSWEYIPDGTNETINWYVDVSSWAIPSENDVIQYIKEKTGITVKFETPVQDDGQKLATILQADEDDIPDLISVPTSNSKALAMLAKQGVVYDINTLADKWAPTLYDHLPEDVIEWWSYANGKTYGIPNHYYSYEDIPTGTKLQPNGGMMVRKDIFNAWQTYVSNRIDGNTSLGDLDGEKNGSITYASMNGGANKTVVNAGYITTPEGFKAACKFAMENYYGTNKGQITTALELAQFTNTGNASLEWLAEFFAVPFEDEQGNYLYRFTNEAYAEALYYLNNLYSTKVGQNRLISDSNFTAKYDGVGGVIASASAFATLVTPQDYQMHFQTAKEAGYEYVSMYITNYEGDAPVLRDIRGYGYLFNMVSVGCQRPDLVIKLLDFLSSDEGQRIISLGVEGNTWNWSDSTKTEIVYTEEYLADKALQTTAKYGALTFDLLINYQYYDNVQPKTNHGKTENELFRSNLKRPLSVYAYDCNATSFVVDATDERFDEYNNTLTRVDQLIMTQLPKILKASSKSAAVELYEQTLTLLESRNIDLVLEMQQAAYQAAKQKLGITVAWPMYQDGFVSPLDRTKPNGDLSLYRGY